MIIRIIKFEEKKRNSARDDLGKGGATDGLNNSDLASKVVLDCEGYPPEHKEEISGPDDLSLARKLTPRRGIPSHIFARNVIIRIIKFEEKKRNSARDDLAKGSATDGLNNSDLAKSWS